MEVGDPPLRWRETDCSLVLRAVHRMAQRWGLVLWTTIYNGELWVVRLPPLPVP